MFLLQLNAPCAVIVENILHRYSNESSRMDDLMLARLQALFHGQFLSFLYCVDPVQVLWFLSVNLFSSSISVFTALLFWTLFHVDRVPKAHIIFLLMIQVQKLHL